MHLPEGQGSSGFGDSTLPNAISTTKLPTNKHFLRGAFKLVGRTKELIKYNGFQVSPSELEQYISCHPAVADCAVSYKLDPHKNELPTAMRTAFIQYWTGIRIGIWKGGRV
ncbi:4-coumarate- ligase [Fusarium acutatum]|uniref:4-coumarate- ligase n=1 Tax=Fusarium acutatum TaxID=78861 RepID=A0A8H4NNH8_9HYPO|nr:4-coumarate- ligase [Fusarium acutatum]